jgi:hypothetical protein
MAIIKSGASSDQLSIDATSKAARVTLYDTSGNSLAQQATYRASTSMTVAAAASATAPFFVIYGSSSKVIRVQRVVVSGPSTTTAAIQGFELIKYSTAPSGGTATALTQVPLDSASPAGTSSLCQVYTAAPTAGTAVGTLGSIRMINKSTTVVDGSEMSFYEFDFREYGRNTPIILRSTSHGVGLELHVATATTVAVFVEWTEE